MDILDSKFNKYSSSHVVSSQYTYENCESMDANYTPNNETTNTQAICLQDTADDYASNSSNTVSYAGAQALSQSPVSSLLDELPFASTNNTSSESESDEPNDDPPRRRFTDQKFDAYEFRDALRQMHKDMTELQEKGGYAYGVIQEFKDIMVEYKDDIDIETYYMVSAELKRFIHVHNSAKSVNGTIKKMTSVMNNSKLLEETFFGLKKVDKRQDIIQQRIAEIKTHDIPVIFQYTKIVQEKQGLFSILLLPRLKKVEKECEELVSAIHEQTQCINDTLQAVDRKTRISNNDSDDEITIGIVVRYRNNDKVSPKSKANERETQAKKEEEQNKIRICKFEHNIPFCSNCGWRTSWLKSFKKRGVFVKEVANGTNNHIWFNDLNKS